MFGVHSRNVVSNDWALADFGFAQPVCHHDYGKVDADAVAQQCNKAPLK